MSNTHFRSLLPANRRAVTGRLMSSGMIQISVYFDEETFNALVASAKREDTTFAEQVRKYVEWGIESERSS